MQDRSRRDRARFARHAEQMLSGRDDGHRAAVIIALAIGDAECAEQCAFLDALDPLGNDAGIDAAFVLFIHDITGSAGWTSARTGNADDEIPTAVRSRRKESTDAPAILRTRCGLPLGIFC